MKSIKNMVPIVSERKYKSFNSVHISDGAAIEDGGTTDEESACDEDGFTFLQND